MKCPVCQMDLYVTERQGVEIDFCTQCRGVWLDRGELDKIIERLGSVSSPRRDHEDHEPRNRAWTAQPPTRETDYAYDPSVAHAPEKTYHKQKKKKKFKNFLEEILDFD